MPQPDDVVIIDAPQMEDHAVIARSARWAVLLNRCVARAHSTADAREALGGLGYDVALPASSTRPVSHLRQPYFASLPVTLTGGHGSVAAGVADGPGSSGLGRVDGVSLGCACG